MFILEKKVFWGKLLTAKGVMCFAGFLLGFFKRKVISMIYVFRKEMKKWHTVLWVVLIALVFGGGIGIWRSKGIDYGVIGKVNDQDILFSTYRQSLSDINNRLQMIRSYAKMYGFSEEMFLKGMLGADSPEDFALNTSIKNALWDGIVNDFRITVGSTFLKQEIVKGMPKEFMDENGFINMEAYQNYLIHMSMTPAEFEDARAREVRRSVINKAIEAAAYEPLFLAREHFYAQNSSKSFVVAKLSFDAFMKKTLTESLDEKALDAYFQAHKEAYRTPELKKVYYWIASAKDYADKIVVDDAAIRAFYEKNKSNMFRIAPKVKVRRLVLKIEKGSKKTLDIRNKADELREQALAAPENFSSLIKKYSEHESAKDGGVVDFFGRGTHEKTFEDASFGLKNPLDISGVVRTKEGYEVIQLVERQKASEKPLDVVKDQIAKDLHAKKSIQALRSDLETMMHGAKTDITVLHNFVQQAHFSDQETDWLSSNDVRDGDLAGMLAQRAFGKGKRISPFGFFMLKDEYVIYKLGDTKKSDIPALSAIKETVIKDYQNNKAQKHIKEAVTRIKAGVLNQGVALDVQAEQEGAVIIQTGMITAKDDVKGLEKPLITRLFVLSDKAQVLEYRQGEDYYVAQLVGEGEVKAEDFEKTRASLLKDGKMRATKDMPTAFIASLHRIAKIEIDKNVLNKTMTTRD